MHPGLRRPGGRLALLGAVLLLSASRDVPAQKPPIATPLPVRAPGIAAPARPAGVSLTTSALTMTGLAVDVKTDRVEMTGLAVAIKTDPLAMTGLAVAVRTDPLVMTGTARPLELPQLPLIARTPPPR